MSSNRSTQDVLFTIAVIAYFIVCAIAALLALGVHAGIAIGF